MSSARNNASAVQILPVRSAADLESVRELFQEYAASLSIDLCFQNFQHELATLPGSYAPPSGCLLLAKSKDSIAGCIGLRPIEASVAELKRLFVRPGFRRGGIGRQLVTGALSEARRIGYSTVRLDTLAEMKPAIALYASFGFREIPRYNEAGPEEIRYFELHL